MKNNNLNRKVIYKLSPNKTLVGTAGPRDFELILNFKACITWPKPFSPAAPQRQRSATIMKKKLTTAILFLVVFFVGCILGALVQYFQGGYWYKVLKAESFPFPEGQVTLSYTAESIGMPFLDPETSVLTVKTKYGIPIIVYKAKRMFQESRPHVQDVKIDTNQVSWQDGINTYHLTVTPMEEKAEPGT